MGLKNHILLVDDDPDCVTLMKHLLNLDGHTVESVELASDAIERFEGAKFDLIILDYMLPDLDGISLLKKIREKNKDIPVIMVTAKTQDWDRDVATMHGVSDYITKPFKQEEFLAAVREAKTG